MPVFAFPRESQTLNLSLHPMIGRSLPPYCCFLPVPLGAQSKDLTMNIHNFFGNNDQAYYLDSFPFKV